jgi:succinoglycan biosynthesis protein ExoA
MDNPPPLISVIIAVYNEEAFLAQTLNQIREQNYPKDRYEVLLIDGLSTDNTLKIAESFQDRFHSLRIFSNPQQLAGSSRNIGIKNSQGEYLIFIDGHVYIPGRELFADMIAAFEKTGCEVLSRPQPLTPPDNSDFQNAVAYARESMIGHGLDSTIYNMLYEGEVDPSSSGAMYKRSIFEAVGLVDESFDAAEDYELNYRISRKGYKSFISPKLAIFFYPRSGVGGLFQQMSRYGQGRNRFIRKHPGQLVSGNLIPPLFYLLLLFMAILSAFWSPLWPFTAGLAILYLAAILLSSAAVSLKRGMKYYLFLPIIYVTIHFGLAYGFISGFFRKPHCS